MKKYQTEFKLEVVKRFLTGEGGAKLLARLNRPGNREVIRLSQVGSLGDCELS